uniref:BED-type domain-containing protein n=1 Tax=Zea mays TaxID=4577 RepID=A0A804UMC6_MAIZE
MERVSSALEMDEAASTDQSSRLTKRRAKVWDYVDTEVVDGKEKAVCKYCSPTARAAEVWTYIRSVERAGLEGSDESEVSSDENSSDLSEEGSGGGDDDEGDDSGGDDSSGGDDGNDGGGDGRSSDGGRGGDGGKASGKAPLA